MILTETGDLILDGIIKKILNESIRTMQYPNMMLKYVLEFQKHAKHTLYAVAVNTCMISLLLSGLELDRTFVAISVTTTQAGETVIYPIFEDVKEEKAEKFIKTQYTFIYDMSTQALAYNTLDGAATVLQVNT